MADKDFTPRELEIMAKAWNCMTVEPQVDYNKLAEACGMTNPRSASNAWAGIKKKIQAKGNISKANGTADGDDGTPTATPKATPKPTPTPRKRARKAQDKDDGEATPSKKAKGRKGKATKSEETVDEDEDAKASPVKQESGDEMT